MCIKCQLNYAAKSNVYAFQQMMCKLGKEKHQTPSSRMNWPPPHVLSNALQHHRGKVIGKAELSDTGRIQSHSLANFKKWHYKKDSMQVITPHLSLGASYPKASGMKRRARLESEGPVT